MSEPMCMACYCCPFETCGQSCHLRDDIHAVEDEIATLTAQLAAVTAGRDAATKRVATLENDLEHALASVGAFRQAIEDVWAKSAGESGDDGFIVSYVIPVGVLHRAIGLARGTDAGGTLLARLAASEAARERAEQVIADVQFDLINCHLQNACAHIQDALNIVNRHGAALAAGGEGQG